MYDKVDRLSAQEPVASFDYVFYTNIKQKYENALNFTKRYCIEL